MTGFEPAPSTLTGGALPLCYITMAPVQGFEPRPIVINSHVPCQLGDTGLIAQEGLDPSSPGL